jgi:hypothetical protein
MTNTPRRRIAELKARGPAQPDGLPDTTLALLR